MIAAIDWTAASTVLSGFAIFFVVALIPGAIWFHRKVIRPLSFVLGLKAEESPTGEAIPPIPSQLADMRKNQIEFKSAMVKQDGQIAIIKAELFPNHGGSLRDTADRAEAAVSEVRTKVIDLDKKFTPTSRRSKMIVRVGNAAEVTTLDLPDSFSLEQKFRNAVGALSLHLRDEDFRWVESDDAALNTLIEGHYTKDYE